MRSVESLVRVVRPGWEPVSDRLRVSLKGDTPGPVVPVADSGLFEGQMAPLVTTTWPLIEFRWTWPVVQLASKGETVMYGLDAQHPRIR